ncbi:hypothetical protein [Faecalicoccus pleomorphus]|uniref:hypothetical protein n=1 Tax=Faecalicoccus pleomorphus TaxID=1323 RepID=UPI00195FAD3F|nr:hypothetical protein [Faecalicoccus pleomorphus]MBM6808324.1 hypothetical protein [Faecalicoccus pleomorphus]
MRSKKNLKEQLQKQIEFLEVKKQKLIDVEIKKIVKSNEEILSLDTKINAYKKLLKRKNEEEKRILDIDQEISNALNGNESEDTSNE